MTRALPHSPRVSIGLAVYNGENFLRPALDSLLAQTFTDFELIITDNASTDDTEIICREYVAKDERIRYYRNTHNIGGIRNQNLTMELARGEYYKMAAHDDVCAPDFLRQCVAALDIDSSIVLAYTKTNVIDENGQFYHNEESYVKHTNENILAPAALPNPSERFYATACLPHSCHPIFGVIRMSAIRSMPLLASYAGSDKTFLGRLSLKGRFYEVPECLFYLRRHSSQSINLGARSPYLYNIWYDTSNAGKLVLPFLSRFFEYLSGITQTPMRFSDRLACYLQMVNVLRVEWKAMTKDVVVGMIQIGDLVTSRLINRRQPSADRLEKELMFNWIPKINRVW